MEVKELVAIPLPSGIDVNGQILVNPSVNLRIGSSNPGISNIKGFPTSSHTDLSDAENGRQSNNLPTPTAGEREWTCAKQMLQQMLLEALIHYLCMRLFLRIQWPRLIAWA